MKKILLIAWKDFTLTYRDFTALLLIIAAPLAMTLVMVFAFGTDDAAFNPIPVAVVNNDQGLLGEIMEGVFSSDEIKAYVAVEKHESLDNALSQMDDDRLAAVVVIPESSFSALADFPARQGATPFSLGETTIQLYNNPVRPISSLVMQAILDSVLIQLNTATAAGYIALEDLIRNNLITPEDLQDNLDEALEKRLSPLFTQSTSSVRLETYTTGENGPASFSWLSYMAPSMAILFLAFSMNASSRTILREREKGTLPRLLTSPSSPGIILTGKMMGTFLVGVIQVLVFIFLSTLILNLHWGPLLPLLTFTLAVVLAVASWGIVVAALSRNSGEASAVGTAILLVFAALAGNFAPRTNFPEWLKTLGYITPNAWGIEGYFNLINGAPFSEIIPSILALGAMSAVLIFIASLFFRRQYSQGR